MRSATIALSVAGLLLSPQLAACAPLPAPEVGSAYTGAGGQAPGGSTTRGSGLGLLGDGVGLFSHNAGDGGQANSGDATALAHGPLGDASGNAYSGVGGNAAGGSVTGADNRNGTVIDNLLHLGSYNAGNGGQANSGDAFASSAGAMPPVHAPNGNGVGDAVDPLRPHVKMGKRPRPSGNSDDGHLTSDSAPASSDDTDSRPPMPDSGAPAPADDDDLARIPTAIKKVKPHRGDKGGDGGDAGQQPAGVNTVGNVAAPASAAYSGVGGQAYGGGVTGNNGLINILSNNAGDGGNATSGAANAGDIPHVSSIVTRDSAAYSGVGGQSYGGSTSGNGGLINLLSNNAGDGGHASSGSSTAGGLLSAAGAPGSAYSGAGGQSYGGNVANNNGLINILSNNAGQGGNAASGASMAGVHKRNLIDLSD